MNLTEGLKLYPFDGVHFLHNLPPVHHPDEKPGLVRRKAHNLYRKAVHAGKWQNFAAGIGTGAAYVSLHGLHWHPQWITIIEYVCHRTTRHHAFISHRCTTQTHPFLYKRHHILRQSDTIDYQHTVCVRPPLGASAECSRSHLFSAHLRKDIIKNQLIDPTTPLFAPLIVLDYGTICIGVMLYAEKLGATQMNSFQGLFW